MNYDFNQRHHFRYHYSAAVLSTPTPLQFPGTPYFAALSKKIFS